MILRSAKCDQGARVYLRRHAAHVTVVACGDVAAGYDIDER
ncbi:hypothetical protein [Plantactinospora mayteni]|nr:hypothetical protein [Plantactinospora mayteni]